MKRFFVIALSVLMVAFFSVAAGAAQPEKIFVSADGDKPSAMVSSVAARGPFFLVFDKNGKFLEAMANPHKDAGGSASALVTELLVSHGAKVMISGHFGGKMTTALQGKGITHVEVSKKQADEAVKKYLGPK
jgi:predicted Fe-Mo cluster-binding NifX family protein